MWATLIVFVASLLRLTDISTLAHGLHYDEAAYVLNIRDIAYNGDRPIFVQAFVGREVGFLYWSAPWLIMANNGTWGTRLASAMLSVIGVAAVFSMTRSLFYRHPRRNLAGLIAALWLALATAPLIFGRYGYRAGSQPVIEILTLWAVFSAGNKLKTKLTLASVFNLHTIVAGILIGLNAYTYLAARLFPIPLGFAMLVMLIESSALHRKKLALTWVIMLAVALLIFMPLGLFFLRNPDIFFARYDQVGGSVGWTEVIVAWLKCMLGLFVPTMGDPNVRYNIPLEPVLSPPFAISALFGLWALVRHKTISWSVRALIWVGIPVMLIPSALAVKDIVPSNIRMIGVWAFLAPLVGLGAVYGVEKAQLLNQRWQKYDLVNAFRRVPVVAIHLICAVALMFVALFTWLGYNQWNHSTDLYNATDGNMTAAGQAVANLSVNDVENATIYVASIHYQSPTVAALTSRFNKVKWLTGGATLVLPPKGDALYILPRFVDPPTSYPKIITQRWVTDTQIMAPDGNVSAVVMRLRAVDVAEIRTQLPAPQADFAHIIKVRDVQPIEQCRVLGPCVAQLIWEPMAKVDFALQPVLRLIHPDSGEWARAHPFHYPTAEWTPSEIVFDQIELTPPNGTPPVTGYELAVSVFNPNTQDSLARVGANEQFAGLEHVLPFGALGVPLADRFAFANPICQTTNYKQSNRDFANGARLKSWLVSARQLRAGEAIKIELCWQGNALPMTDLPLRVRLEGPENMTLYEGVPAQGRLPFSQWQAGANVLDRFALRLPRLIKPGAYVMILSTPTETVDLGRLEVNAPTRQFLPEATPPNVSFNTALKDLNGDLIALSGFDAQNFKPNVPTKITLYWRSMAETSKDYVVFVHLIDPKTGQIVAQSDGQPIGGQYPTSLWAKGEYVRDEHMLAIGNLPQGKFQLRIGMYLPYSGERLLADGAEWVSQEIVIDP
jgi:uncharacterized membrane protein